MRHISWIWWIILIIAVALLAIPATRETVRGQIGVFSPLSLVNYFEPSFWEAENPRVRVFDWAVERARAKFPKDGKVALGAGLIVSDKNKQLSWLKEAAQLAPGDPVPLAALSGIQIRELRYRRKEDIGYGRPMPPGWGQLLLTPQQARPAREALEQWQKSDSDNAAPKALLAWLDFGEKRDAAGFAQLQAAVRAPETDFYYPALMAAQIRTLKAGGLAEFDAAFYGMALQVMPEYAKLRSVARVALYQGNQAQAEGQPQKAIEHWQTILTLGRNLRYREKTGIGKLVGIAIEAIGASPVYKWSTRRQAKEFDLKPAYTLTGKTGRYNGGDIYQGRSYDFFVKQAGSKAAAEILAGLEQGQKCKLLAQQYFGWVTAFNLEKALIPLSSGALMLIEAGIFLVLALLAGLPTRRLQDRPIFLARVWAILLALLALSPIWAHTLTRILAEPSHDFGMDLYSLTRPVAGYFYFIPPFALLFLLSLASTWIWLKAKEIPVFRRLFIGLIRQTAPVVLLLLILSYAWLTIHTAQLRAKAVRQIEIIATQGETAQMQREHPELFRPPVAAETTLHR